MRFSTATRTSMGVLPAPAPRPAAEASMRFAPAAIGRQRVGHAHGHVVVAVEAQLGRRLQRERTGPIARLTSSGSMKPAESVT
jgi:hypothetical protein